MLKKRLTSLALALISLTGAIMLAYPTVANAWNDRHATRVIAEYTEELSAIDNAEYADLWEKARSFNEQLKNKTARDLTEEELKEYESILNVSGTGILGYVEIPVIKVSLPIYHGTSEGVLQIAAGHIEWTSLPTGGVGNHCAVSGHRGLASAKLFSDLPQMQLGDVFYIRVLNELMTYEVDQIKTVLPWELDDISPQAGQDYFTLVTCTPYGINSHRLLVRGHRIPNDETTRSILVPADAIRIEPMIVAPILAFPIVFILIMLVIFAPQKKKTEIDKLKEEIL